MRNFSDLKLTFGMKIPHNLQLATHLSPITAGCGQLSGLHFGRADYLGCGANGDVAPPVDSIGKDDCSNSVVFDI